MSRARRLSVGIGVVTLAELTGRLAPIATLRHAEARLGGPAFGFASLGMSLFDLALPLMGFGYAAYAARAVAAAGDDDELASRRAVAVVVLRLAHAAVAFAALLWTVRAVPGYAAYRDFIPPLGFILFALAFDVDFLAAARGRVVGYALLSLATRLAAMAAVLVLVRDAGDVRLYAGLLFAAGATTAVGSVVAHRRRLRWRSPRLADLRATFVAALPVNVATGLFWALDRADLVLVEAARDMTAVGAYTGPYRVALALTPFLAGVARVFVAEGLATGASASRGLVAAQVGVLSAAVLPLAAGAWLVGSEVLAAVLGPAFGGMGRTLALLTLASGAMAWSHAYGLEALAAGGRAWRVAGVLAVALAGGAAAASVVARQVGGPGVAVGLLGAKAAAAAALAALAAATCGTPPWRALARVAAATAVMSGVVVAAEAIWWPGRVALGATAYLASLGLAHALRRRAHGGGREARLIAALWPRSRPRAR